LKCFLFFITRIKTSFINPFCQFFFCFLNINLIYWSLLILQLRTMLRYYLKLKINWLFLLIYNDTCDLKLIKMLLNDLRFRVQHEFIVRATHATEPSCWWLVFFYLGTF
jgi:hypothetical protein